MTDPEQQSDELDDDGGTGGGDTVGKAPESEQTGPGPGQAEGLASPVSQYAADPEPLTWSSGADLEAKGSDAEEAYVVQDTGRRYRRVGPGGVDSVGSTGAVDSGIPRVSGQVAPAPVQGSLPTGSRVDTPGAPVAVGYVTPMRGSGVRYWLAWGMRIYVIAMALLILLTGVSMINAEGVDGWVPLGSLILGTGMLLPMFYYGVARERDRQQFVRRLAEAQDVTVDLREKDIQALVYSTSLPATLQRTKRNWVVWGTVSAVIIIIGLALLAQGLEASTFTYYPGGFAEPDASLTSVSVT